jgi:acyl-coenzyme A thioesterase PaaI-like protein
MAADIRSMWDRLSGRPGGRWVFSKLLGRLVPYTGTIKPRVLELTTTGARIEMRDRRVVRNHLDSVHAIALANLAELSTGLPLAYAVQPRGRAILLSLTVEFLKKARGTLVGSSSFVAPAADRDEEIEIPVEVRDASGTVVARARARWRVGPVKPRG